MSVCKCFSESARKRNLIWLTHTRTFIHVLLDAQQKHSCTDIVISLYIPLIHYNNSTTVYSTISTSKQD